MAAADVLLMPSYFESLSMVALEAWAIGTPVLANGRCDVLKGQVIRSGAGLYYENFAEFAEALHAITLDARAAAALSARTGARSSARTTTGPSSSGSTSTCSTGWTGARHAPRPHGAAARVLRPAPPHAAAGRRRGCRRSRRSGARVTRPAVHQVLATLGYGDAIGHEVLGIRHVLRAAGYESDIFVETADPRLEDLTRDYRELVDASHPDNLLLHHFSIGSKASRVAFALPDRMALIYHNITPPEYFVGVHDLLVELCYLGRRELSAYVPRCELALGDSEFNRQELEAIGFAHTGVLPVVPGFSHLDGPADPFIARDFDDEWVNLLFVGPHHPEQADRRADPDLPRLQDTVQPALAADCRRGVQRLRDVPGDAARARRAPRREGRAPARPRERRASWSRTTTSPTSSSRRASTRASACR